VAPLDVADRRRDSDGGSILRVLNKVLAALAMGLVGWFVIGLPITLMLVPSLRDPSVGWAFLGPGIAVVATIAVTVLAPTGRVAWGRLCFLNGIASVGLLPLAGTVFMLLLGHRASQLAMSDVAKAGWKLGAGLGALTLGLEGFLLGAIFLALAFAILRNAQRPSSPAR